MQTYFIEFRHVDATTDFAEDAITEWIAVLATSEEEAFTLNAERFHAENPNRGITSQEII